MAKLIHQLYHARNLPACEKGAPLFRFSPYDSHDMQKKIFNNTKTKTKTKAQTKPNAPRSKNITIRLSEAEKEDWNARAEAAGCGNNLSKFIRLSVEDGSIIVPQSIPEINYRIFVELSRIGNNINQIAKAINISLKSGNLEVSDCSGEIEALKILIKEIKFSIIEMSQDK